MIKACIAKRGFSLVEVLVVVILAAILSGMGVVVLRTTLRDQKVTRYGTQVEYLIKYARMHAMEKTTNVGICVSGNRLTLYDVGTSRTSTTCSGTQIVSMGIEAGDVSGSGITLTGSSVSVDPRGLAIYPGLGGNACVTNSRKYYKVTVARAGVRVATGSGGCP